ncbi:MAG: efflux RND transporter periplasmic adaptor subunit [Candidatus Binatus sp.]|uniref:efflux RND transporter periplasmic adaptor subunit n=1 Tax=Candidatus Binatus sp. TaxID=2811406 RepID=UPI002724C89B|nr:efflux RND transporter periplasmic adaptor subunit [Candidatus Binatus sp.]MDO8431878.1 efflux RND transporter periplasmic adaptor subunit [Candidatus Binatus sp.]
MKLPSLKISAWIAVAAIIAIAGFYFYGGSSSATKTVSAKVTRGAIVRSVSATGTVNPVVTVQVGSYVSGPISAIYADFNSPVKQGQLIAKIDPRQFQVKVNAAKAALANAKAQLGKDSADMVYRKVTYERDAALLEEGVISKDAVDSAKSTYEQVQAQLALDRANIQQQQANLEDAEVSLNYTNIISPVDGTVVSRNVDVGQTVAASFQTPTLFLIAKDLTKMQVDSNVSESDIGDVRQGLRADFKVDAFPDRMFEGVVGQVRQAPITVQNVVTYDVVVNVENPELLLKPGMTANVTLVTARRDNVVRIPMEALRFAPRGSPIREGNAVDGAAGRGHARVWIPDGRSIKPVSITIGLSDGSFVEMLEGPLREGDLVVTDQIKTGPKSTGNTSPFVSGPRMR